MEEHMTEADYKNIEGRNKMTTMKVTVIFEANAGAHVVAQFDEESTYMACLPALEQLAASQGYIVTESVTYEENKKPKTTMLKNLVIEWSDGKTEDLINVLPEYLYMELNAYLRELQDLRAECDAGMRDEPYHFETGEQR
jgi:hypothetical protein